MKTFPKFADFINESKVNAQTDDPLNEGEGGMPAASGDCGGMASDVGALDGSAAFMHGGEPITTAGDVLGKCDAQKGCMGHGDFHIPKMVGSLYHRWPCCNGGSKRKKDKNGKAKKYYPEKGMKVITSYADLTEDEKVSLKPVLVYNIPFDRVPEILDNTAIENPRFDRVQITKYLNGSDNRDLEVVGLFDKFPKECLAIAVLAFDSANADDCYICEIQSFKKGYGKELILKLMKYQKKLWLMANVTAVEKLLDFYRDPAFKFEEYAVANSIYDCPAHFFYTKDCDEDKLRQYIDEFYSYDKDLNESLIKNAITWYHGANEREQFKLRKPNWNRPFFLTNDISYANEYSDYGVYEIMIADAPRQDILDFDTDKDANKLGWPKVLIDKIRQGKSDLNAIAYDMWILVNDPAQELLQIDDTIEWQAAAEWFEDNKDDILEVTSRSHWQDDKDNQYVLKMWSDIARAGFSGFTHNEFGHRVLALFDIVDIAKVKKVDSAINESKNKLTAHPKMIQQKKVSLKTNTTEKADKIIALKVTAAKEKEFKAKQGIFKKPVEKRVIANQLRSRESKMQSKHTISQKEVKDFKKAKIAVKNISFPRSEVKKLKTQMQIITTRAGDDYDKYQLGDIVKTPWGAKYTIIGRRNIGSVMQHPYKDELTDKQVEELKKYDKLAVLTLALQNAGEN